MMEIDNKTIEVKDTNKAIPTLKKMIRKYLEEQGHMVFEGSNTRGPWDLVAIDGFNVVLIQVRKEMPTIFEMPHTTTGYGDKLFTHMQTWVHKGDKKFDTIDIKDFIEGKKEIAITEVDLGDRSQEDTR